MRRIALLSNVTVDFIIAKLIKEYHVYSPDGFDTWVSDVMDPSSRLYGENMDAVFVLLDGRELWDRPQEEIQKRTGLWEAAIEALGRQTDTLLFVSTIDFRENRIRAFGERQGHFRQMDSWYQFIWRLSQKRGNTYALDIVEVIVDMGRNHFYSSKMWYMGSMPYSKAGIEAVAGEIRLAMEAAFTSRRKVAVLDLDNTLWGGVIGEDGIDGIVLSEHNEGARYQDFQRCLLEMKKRGTVLAVSSKNNGEDAEAAFRHPAMVLKPGDFVSIKANWGDKASSIKEMEEELNLTEGSFVFIDDNPMEREVVSGQCPEVFVPEFPKDTAQLPEFAKELYKSCFRPLRLMDEDRKKTEMYQSEAGRKEVRARALDLDEYIRMLKIKADIHLMREDEEERACQLCGKANQFNLTTKRYSLRELQQAAAANGTDVFTVSTSDKFGDSGLIGVVITKVQGQDVLIDTFLMSCRVMGRKLEHVIMHELTKHYRGRKQLIGVYERSPKNAPVGDLYDRLGFSLVQVREERKEYSYDLSKPYPKVTGYEEVIFHVPGREKEEGCLEGGNGKWTSTISGMQ